VFVNDGIGNVVLDFTHGLDLLDVSEVTFDGKSSGLNASGLMMTQIGSNTEIYLLNFNHVETVIVLENVSLSDLDADDFIF